MGAVQMNWTSLLRRHGIIIQTNYTDMNDLLRAVDVGKLKSVDEDQLYNLFGAETTQFPLNAFDLDDYRTEGTYLTASVEELLNDQCLNPGGRNVLAILPLIRLSGPGAEST
jgi:hypothetical protein